MKVRSRLLSTSPLIDNFQRFHNYLRISLTERCNLRCVYCMPMEGVKLTPEESLMTIEERKKLIRIFVSLGVNKIRFTGGEPTISDQLPHLIEYSRSFPSVHSVGLTSNGLLLKDKLDSLISAGLTSINISLDTLSEEKFSKIARRDGKWLNRVLTSIYSAVDKGLPVKVNCVVMRGVNDDEISTFVKLAKEFPTLDCRFIELMPFDGNEWSPNSYMSHYEIIDKLKIENDLELIRIDQSKDPHDTTKWYKVNNMQSFLGRIGFITSMSSHFCGGCNRLRITADGKLKVCLFGQEELSLLKSIRDGLSDEEISFQIGASVQKKTFALGGHGSIHDLAKSENRPMILIGG